MSELVLEKSNELPKGWAETKLDDICELIGGGTPSRQNPEYFNGDILWLTPTEIPKNKIIKIKDSKEKITELGLKKSSAKIIPKNSVLLTSRASIGYVAIAGTDVTTNQGFASFVCNNIIYNSFLAYWLFGKKELLESKATGTTFKEISKSKLRELEFKLPPLNEQKRIVLKIEELFSVIEAIQRNFEQIEQQFSTYWQSFLRYVYTGKITQSWRNNYSGKITNAESIVHQIKSDSPLDYEVISNEFVSLPDEWLWIRLGMIVDMKNGINFTKEQKGIKGIPTIDVLNMYSETNYVDLDKIYRVDKKINNDYILEDGDILFVRSSVKREGVGWATLFSSSSEPVTFCGFLIRGRLKTPKIIPEYLINFLRSAMARNQIIQASSQVTITNIRQPSLAKTIFPLAPYEEQKQIAKQINTQLLVFEQNKKIIKRDQKFLNIIKSLILKQAFEGKLVPQDLNDEPAEILLEKIKQEKEQLLQKQKPSRRKKNGK